MSTASAVANAVGGLLLDEEGRVLLTQRADKMWACPGGAAPAEGLRNALARNLWQRRSIRAHRINRTAIVAVEVAGESPIRWTLYRVSGFQTLPDRQDGNGFGWFSTAEMPHLDLAVETGAALLSIARESLRHVYGDRAMFSCGACGGSVKLTTGPGRTRRVWVRPHPVPDDYPTPVCTHCGDALALREVNEPLDAALGAWRDPLVTVSLPSSEPTTHPASLDAPAADDPAWSSPNLGEP